MNFEDYLPEAIDTVLAWDIPEKEFAQAVNHQAHLMAGEHFDDIWLHEPEDPYSLRHSL